MNCKDKFYLGATLVLKIGPLTCGGRGLWEGWGVPGHWPRRGEIECIVGSRDQRFFQGWPLDSPHVCHGIRHAGCPTLHSLASLLFSEFKPKVHGEKAIGDRGCKEAAESRFRTILLARRCFLEILWQRWEKKKLVFHTIPLGTILYHFAKNWICLLKSSTAIGSARVWSVVAATLTFSLASSTSHSPPASTFLFYVDLSVSNLDGKFLTTVCESLAYCAHL